MADWNEFWETAIWVRDELEKDLERSKKWGYLRELSQKKLSEKDYGD
jgi:hypothetical protein